MPADPVLSADAFDADTEFESPAPEAYEITAAPSDFNTATLHSFIKSGVVKIPGFQRHYVWDLRRASKLIESLLIGLPIPQIFLYEAARNSFLVVDGQQRLMSLYYFREGRFPIESRRPELRQLFDRYGKIPEEIFRDDAYFSPFALKLPPRADGTPNEYQGLRYDTLGDLQASFDIKTIRNVIIKQLVPKDDMSSVYEIFSRLNSGGENLERQELRSSLYHSMFYDMLGRVNEIPGWRTLLGEPEPNLHLRDIQHLLRAFALLCADYSSSMVQFLDRFSLAAKKMDAARVEYLESLFRSFIRACVDLPDAVFQRQGSGFAVMLFEATFYAACHDAYAAGRVLEGRLDAASIEALRLDAPFVEASSARTTSTANVGLRLDAARRHVRMSA